MKNVPRASLTALPGTAWRGPEAHYSFGSFELYPERRLLLDAGAPVRLGPRAFDLLVILAERSGEVVPQADLLRSAWPHATVDDVALRVHLSALRKALQSGNVDYPSISNVPGRGYTLTLPVQRIVEEDGKSEHTVPQTTVSLPSAGKHLIGRDGIIVSLQEKLRDTRFLSIVGPGGIGKTSVALRMAEEAGCAYPDGVAFVDLAVITDPNLLWSGIASAAQIATFSEDVAKAVIGDLRGKRRLLVLDNCEHLIEEAASAAEKLWREVPSLDILVTSREPLRADSEWIHWLPPLDVPADFDSETASDIRQYSAIQLLTERTSACSDGFVLRDGDLPLAVALCRKLDGLPLAIELIASGVVAFGVRTVAAHVDDRHNVMMKGSRTAVARHQTLGAALDWSFDVLSEIEKTVFLRFAVFQGGVDFATAVSLLAYGHITAEDVVEAIYALHAKSLLSADLSQDEISYRLLETTRRYALAKLKGKGEYLDLAARHANLFCELFRNAESDWDDLSQQEWLQRYARHLVNLRSALEWAMSDTGDLGVAKLLLVRTPPLWTELGIIGEYVDRLNDILQRIDQGGTADISLDVRLKLEWAKSVWISRGPSPQIIQVAKDVLALDEVQDSPAQQMEALWLLWDQRTVFEKGEVKVIVAVNDLVETSADPVIQLAGLRMIAIDLHYRGNQRLAWDYHTRTSGYSEHTFRRVRRIAHRGDQKLAHMTLAARLLWLRGYPDQAVAMVNKGLAYAETLHPTALVYFLGFAACPVTLWCGDLVRAGVLVCRLNEIATRHSLAFWQGLGEVYEIAISRLGLRCAHGRALPEDAASRFIFNQLELFATIHPDLVSPVIRDACETQVDGWGLAEALRAKAMVLPDQLAEPLLNRALEVARRQGALSWELRAATSMADLFARTGRRREAVALIQSVVDRFTEGHGTHDLNAASNLLTQLSNAGAGSSLTLALTKPS